MNSIINFFISSYIYVSLCVVSLALATQYLLLSFNIQVLCFLFFATFISYNFQRLASIYKNPEHSRNQWYIQNRLIISALFFLSVIIFFGLIYSFSVQSIFLVLGLSLLSLLYSVKLRDIPYLKIYLIAASWCFSTILLTVLENKLTVDLEIILSIIGRFFFLVAITIPFDIRDLNFDKKRLKTLPILFGAERSKKIALIMLLLFLILEFFHYVVFSWEINFFLASLLCFGYTYYLIKKSGMDRNRFYYSFWVESCSISLVVFLIITAIFL